MTDDHQAHDQFPIDQVENSGHRFIVICANANTNFEALSRFNQI